MLWSYPSPKHMPVESRRGCAKQGRNVLVIAEPHEPARVRLAQSIRNQPATAERWLKQWRPLSPGYRHGVFCVGTHSRLQPVQGLKVRFASRGPRQRARHRSPLPSGHKVSPAMTCQEMPAYQGLGSMSSRSASTSSLNEGPCMLGACSRARCQAARRRAIRSLRGVFCAESAAAPAATSINPRELLGSKKTTTTSTGTEVAGAGSIR